ncbi:sulfatase [Nocardioides sp. 503]|uniref:sulfatase family protein n=1 Tax=Nocardioides sp. 503 TaxID=2508326 RepID=UPI00106F8CCF|nr:sulfatase [Nocardioides sp. 503]
MSISRPARKAAPAIAVAAIGALAVTGVAYAGHDGTADRRDASARGDARTPVAPPGADARAAGAKPNILMFTVDDMTVGDLPYMPNLNRLVVRKGTRLTQGTAPTPICVPARASLLTGQYAHNHGALTINGAGGGFKSFKDGNTLPVWLHRAGYETYFSGKYLNGYGVNNPRYIPPGWTGWRGSVDMSTYGFYNTRYNINGKVVTRSAHNSDVLNGFTTDVIGSRTKSRKPWFMWTNFVAPHHGGAHESDDPSLSLLKTTMPAARDRNTFRNLNLPRDPEMWVGGGSPWAPKSASKAFKAAVREANQQRIESLQSVDDAVGAAIRKLRRTGELKNTYVIFTSDNGFLVGHHNRDGKLVPFDRSLRVPMVIRGPGIPQGRTVATPTTNPDIAVTIAGIAGARPGRRVDGVDMLDYWRSTTTYDRPVPIEAYPVQGGRKRIYSGVRYGRWTYVRLPGGKEVLFDRRQDPGETHNVAGRRRNAATLKQLRRLERTYRDCAGATCPRESTFVPAG